MFFKTPKVSTSSAVVDDEVFLPPPSSTPKRSMPESPNFEPKRKRADQQTLGWFNFDEGQRDFKSLFPVALEVSVPWKEPEKVMLELEQKNMMKMMKNCCKKSKL